MRQIDLILDLFRRKKRLTDLEIQNSVTINPNSIRPARLKLLKQGLIRKTDHKRNNYAVYEFVDNSSEMTVIGDLQNTLKKIESQIEFFQKMKTACLKAIDFANQV